MLCRGLCRGLCCTGRLMAAVKLLCTDKKMALLSISNLTFGFTSSFRAPARRCRPPPPPAATARRPPPAAVLGVGVLPCH